MVHGAKKVDWAKQCPAQRNRASLVGETFTDNGKGVH